MRYEIIHKYTGDILFSGELKSLAAAASAAVTLGVSLRDANLRGADLHGVDLSGADLSGADLSDADMRGVDLSGADLSSANLVDANLRDAKLYGADLRGAKLSGADLSDAKLNGADLGDAKLNNADLRGADLRGANMRGVDLVDANLRDSYFNGADMRGADLSGTNMSVDGYYHNRAARYRERHPDIPVIQNLDSRILSIIDAGEGSLDMEQWDSYETNHCRAVWAIVLAGEPGKRLEEKYGPYRAGRMIYLASTGRVPDFFATNEHALEDIRAWASKEEESK